MDFAFNDDQELLASTSRRYLRDRVPLSARRASLELPENFDRQVWLAGTELGWSAMLIPPDFGGGSVTEQPIVDLAALAEELGAVLYSGPFETTNVVADAVAREGSDAQRCQLLPGIASGSSVATWTYTADGSIEPEGVKMVGSPDGENWELTGVARYVPDAGIADHLLATAMVGTGELGQFLINLPVDGCVVRPMKGIDLTSRLYQVEMTGVSAERLGGDARAAIDRQVSLSCVLQCGECVGAANELFGMTVQYAKDRQQFGRPIGSFQVIKHKLANMLIQLEAMRASSHDAALELDQASDEADIAISTAKSYIGDAFVALAGEALQIHGGIGFTWEHDAHLYLRRAISERVRLGDPSWHRERIFALHERGMCA